MDGKKFDLGAHWVGESQCNIMELLKEYHLETESQKMDGRILIQIGRETSTFGSSNWLATLELGWVMRKLNNLALKVRKLDSEAAEAKDLDAITIHSWINQHIKEQKLLKIRFSNFLSMSISVAEVLKQCLDWTMGPKI